jgi:hypothetical protein
MATAFTFSGAHGDNTEELTAFAFIGQYEIDASSVAMQIAHVARDQRIKGAAIVTPRFLAGYADAILSLSEFRGRLPKRLRTDEALQHISISQQGQVFACVTSSLEEISGAALRAIGMEALFQRYSPILDGRRGYHFRKPSQAHSQHFVRVAELLNDAVEVEFLAIWLLPFLTTEIRVISCDTTSIAAVAHSAISLLQRFSALAIPIEVNTFHSYNFASDEVSPRSDTLYLMSATTSGALEKLMVKKGVRAEQIVTLYSLGDQVCSDGVLCNLSATGCRIRNSLPRIENFQDAATCPLCRDKIPFVEIVGDQFLPIRTEIEMVQPNAPDAPSWVAPLMQDTAGARVYRCHFGRGVFENIHDLWIDVGALLATDTFRIEFIKHLHQGTPALLDQIFYVGHGASEELAAIAQHFVHKWTGRIVPIDRLTERSASRGRNAGTALVLTSAVSSGDAILGASQLLRDLRPEGRVAFIIGVIRARSKQDAQRLKNNLRFTPSRNYRFALHVVEEIYLPDNTRSADSSWRSESQFLKGLMVRFPEIPQNVRVVVEARIAKIESALGPNERGLIDSCFWGAPNGRQLSLRSNFSLFPFDYRDRQVSQADVFFVVSALLHRMRSDPTCSQRLDQTPYKRTILDPEVFRRYSDGILQAALLRASQQPELDYMLGENFSVAAAGVLNDLLLASDVPKREARTEFLLAICLETLKLLPREMKPLINRISQASPQDSVDYWLCEFLLSQP